MLPHLGCIEQVMGGAWFPLDMSLVTDKNLVSHSLTVLKGFFLQTPSKLSSVFH